MYLYIKNIYIYHVFRSNEKVNISDHQSISLFLNCVEIKGYGTVWYESLTAAPPPGCVEDRPLHGQIYPLRL